MTHAEIVNQYDHAVIEAARERQRREGPEMRRLRREVRDLRAEVEMLREIIHATDDIATRAEEDDGWTLAQRALWDELRRAWPETADLPRLCAAVGRTPSAAGKKAIHNHMREMRKRMDGTAWRMVQMRGEGYRLALDSQAGRTARDALSPKGRLIYARLEAGPATDHDLRRAAEMEGGCASGLSVAIHGMRPRLARFRETILRGDDGRWRLVR